VIGNTIQAWAELGSGWQLKLTATDTTYTASGFIGLVSDGGPTCRLDNFGGGTAALATDLIADAVWDEDIVAAHQSDDTAGKKLSQALILYEGS
jgi:hypothetical protein